MKAAGRVMMPRPSSRSIKDELISIGGRVGKLSGGIKWADNSLTCDSEGNCMLKDELDVQICFAYPGGVMYKGRYNYRVDCETREPLTNWEIAKRQEKEALRKQNMEIA